MLMLRYCIALCLWVSVAVTAAGNPVDNLLNRIDRGSAEIQDGIGEN